MLNFYLPDFFYLFRLNFYTIHYMKNNPKYFHDNITVKAVYGAFPHRYGTAAERCLLTLWYEIVFPEKKKK